MKGRGTYNVEGGQRACGAGRLEVTLRQKKGSQDAVDRPLRHPASITSALLCLPLLNVGADAGRPRPLSGCRTHHGRGRMPTLIPEFSPTLRTLRADPMPADLMTENTTHVFSPPNKQIILCDRSWAAERAPVSVELIRRHRRHRRCIKGNLHENLEGSAE